MVERTDDQETLIKILATLQRESKKGLTKDSFESRLRLQKTVYLLKAAGFAAAKGFRFNYYIRGPYSSDLAKAYYKWNAGTLTDAREAADPRLSTIAEAMRQGNEFLEATSALHWIHRNNPGVDKKRVFEPGETLKRRLSRLFPEAWRYLENNALLG